MTILTLFRTELRRLTSSKMGIIALIALMCVPVIYAGLYLWGNNDPYGNLKDVPVGLVVEDTGATTSNSDGTTTTVDYGQEVHDELVKDNSVHWIDATAADAKEGVSNGTFDFVLTLGSDFSADLTSPTSDAPRQASVQLTTNDTNSFLATTIAGNVAEKVRASIAEKVGKEAALKFLDGFADVGSSLQTAIDGADQLADGTTTASAGATQLATGAASANDGAQQLASGLDTANSGASTLSSGASSANDAAQKLAAGSSTTNAGMIQLLAGLNTLQSNVSSLPSDTAKLNTGAQGVAAGNAQLAQGGADVKAAADAAAAAVPGVREKVQSTLKTDGLTDDQIAAVLAQIDPLGDAVTKEKGAVDGLSTKLDTLSAVSAQVAAGTATLAASAPALTDGVNQAASAAARIQAGTQQVSDGNAQLAAGTPTLANGAATLSSGIGQLDTGARTLADGTPALATGAADLQSGIQKLDDGAHTLASGLSDGLGKLPIETADAREKTATIISDPAIIDTSAVTKASTYGAGMAPFFISLAAWIGIYALFLIIKPLSKRALTALKRPLRVTAAGWATPAALGAIQMLAVFGIVTLALGYAVANPAGMLGFMVLTSVTYAAIILALNVWLGSVGQFLGLVLMVLQLVTAGGTFPWQTLPGPLAALHHALPMGYAVDGIRQLMYGGNLALAWGDVAVLLAFLVGALALSWLGARRMTRTRTLRDLRPSLIG